MALWTRQGYPSRMTSLPEIASTTIDRHDMLPQGAVVVVMLSGGADSVSLLRVLAAMAPDADLKLSALHVNHLLRAAAADEDESFVRELCASIRIPLRVERVDVAGLAEREGLNLEDAGRRVRYELASQEIDARCAAAGEPADTGRIAVAHTRDDRTETFMMRLAQGAGAAGLTTLKPRRGRIIRPLIEADRTEVREYLDLLCQSWREDESNTDTSRLRARVRHELLPLMRAINPQFDTSLARTVEVLAEEDILLTEMAEAFANDFARSSGERVEFECAMMATLSLPMRRRAVRSAVLQAFPEASRLEFEHVEALVAGLGTEGFARDLPYGLRAEQRYGTMSVSRTVEGNRPVASGLLLIPGIADLGPAGAIHGNRVDAVIGDEGPDVAVIDAASVGGELSVGPYREGDRICPLGMVGSKKVSDLLIDSKIPKAFRHQVPVVRDGDQIVWVAGIRMSESYKVTPVTRDAIRLVWERGPNVADSIRDQERTEATDAS